MAKCYNFYGLFLTRTFKNNNDRCSVNNSNAKPLQVIKSCFTVVVHVGLLREKKLIKSNMRKAFYNKIFFVPKKKNLFIIAYGLNFLLVLFNFE